MSLAYLPHIGVKLSVRSLAALDECAVEHDPTYVLIARLVIDISWTTTYGRCERLGTLLYL